MPCGRISVAVACFVVGMSATAAMAQHEPPKVEMRAVPPPDVAPPTPVQPLVIEAADPAALRSQSLQFVTAFAAASPKLDQLARWVHPICVSVEGLPPDQAAQVEDRVREVAKAVDVGVLKAGCAPNVEIMFTAQPQRLIDSVADTRESLLGYWHRRDRDKLKLVNYPVQSWYTTITVGGADRTGLAFAYAEGGANGASTPAGALSGGEVLEDPDSHTPVGCGESRLTSCLKSALQHVLVVVDTGEVRGQPLGVVADYIAMLTLTQPQSRGDCAVLPSVLDLFNQGCAAGAAAGLSRADAAYLTAFYKANLQDRKVGEEKDIASRMAKILIKAKASPMRASH